MPILDAVSDVPLRMRGLKRDHQGRPIPWFAADRLPGPRYILPDARQRIFALQHKICWLCGQPLGQYLAFVLDTVETLTRQSFEAPLHRQCGVWWLGQGLSVSGLTQGLCALYVAQNFRLRPLDSGRRMLDLGPPAELTWWREGRPALRTESELALQSAFDILTATEPAPRLRLLRRRWSEVEPFLGGTKEKAS